MSEISEQETRRRNPLLWPVRFLLHWTIKLFVLLILGIRAVLRPRVVRFGIVALFLLGAVAWNLLGVGASGKTEPVAASPATFSAASTGDLVSVPTSEKLDRPPIVEKYLKAQANFDANGMWATISDDLKQQLTSSNTSVKELQNELDAAKQSGRQYGQAIYVGGTPLDSNNNAYFYVLTVNTPNGEMHVPYTYVVGSDGKIASIQ